MRREGDPRPAWGEEGRALGNCSHRESFPPWLHTGLNPKTTLSRFNRGGLSPVERWKHLFHPGIWEKWLQSGS